MDPEKRQQLLRHHIEFFYDLQKLRIQSGNRDHSKDVELDDKDKAFLAATSTGIAALEKQALREVTRYLKGHPLYDGYLKAQKGVGPTMAGVILASVDIHKATTVSKLWAYAGLHTVPGGKAAARVKGQKANWNPWLKTKMLEVLGSSFLKCNSPWRKLYDDYKHRKESQRGPCQLCEGSGKYDKQLCNNCEGTGTGPWGRSDAHRHRAAMRYMVKMFLADMWEHWRRLEGLEVRPSYQQEYLGHTHAP